MNELKLLAVVAITTVFVMSAGSHPGPERHPIEQELWDVESQLSAEISALESRLNARIDGLAAPDDDAIADAVESAMNEARVEITQSTSELRVQIEEVVAANQSLMWGLIAVAVVGGLVILVGFIVIFMFVKSQTKSVS